MITTKLLTVEETLSIQLVGEQDAIEELSAFFRTLSGDQFLDDLDLFTICVMELGVYSRMEAKTLKFYENAYNTLMEKCGLLLAGEEYYEAHLFVNPARVASILGLSREEAEAVIESSVWNDRFDIDQKEILRIIRDAFRSTPAVSHRPSPAGRWPSPPWYK